MFIIKDGKKYVGEDNMRKPTMVAKKRLATKYKTKQSAENAIKNLPYLLKKQHDWNVFELKPLEDSRSGQEATVGQSEVEMSKKIQKVENEKATTAAQTIIPDNVFDDNFDIKTFLQDILPVLSNLKEFYNSKIDQEDNINDMILDIRHYLRDNVGKINAIQMQRLGYYQQQLEREREIAKKSYTIAREILDEPEKLLKWNFTKMVNDVFQTPYKPRVLTYKMISEISNTPRGNSKSKKSA